LAVVVLSGAFNKVDARYEVSLLCFPMPETDYPLHGLDKHHLPFLKLSIAHEYVHLWLLSILIHKPLSIFQTASDEN